MLRTCLNVLEWMERFLSDRARKSGNRQTKTTPFRSGMATCTVTFSLFSLLPLVGCCLMLPPEAGLNACEVSGLGAYE